MSMKPTPLKKNTNCRDRLKRKKKRKTTKFKFGFEQKIKNYPKIMYDCHTDRKHSIFFRLGTQ